MNKYDIITETIITETRYFSINANTEQEAITLLYEHPYDYNNVFWNEEFTKIVDIEQSK